MSDQPLEIIIVKRRVDTDHDEAHGGVWKVAFADFMTAMMAFFLVLWIVNSTSKETRVSVARYFNPIRLQETTTAKKSVNDVGEEAPEPGRQGAEAPPAAKATKDNAASVAKQGDASGSAANVGGGAAAPNAQKLGRAIRDPFARAQSPTARQDNQSSVTAKALEQQQTSARMAQGASELRAELTALLGADLSKLGGALEVAVAEDGIAINVTDGADFGMFAVGSASPEPGLMRLLHAVGSALRARGGDIVIRGFTDARRYRSGESDNWQLSVARAAAAQGVLAAGGLGEERIDHIEGYGDRRLKLPQTPEAPQNRRIEILLRSAK